MNYKIIILGLLVVPSMFLTAGAEIYEDQAIVCLTDLNTNQTGDYLCSLYNMDEIFDKENRSKIEYQVDNYLDVFGPEYIEIKE